MNKKLSEFRATDVSELSRRIIELKSELAKERALNASGTKAKNPGKISQAKKSIARIFTIIREKEKQPKAVKEKAVAVKAAAKKAVVKAVNKK